MEKLNELIKDIEAVDNMYLDKKNVLKALKIAKKEISKQLLQTDVILPFYCHDETVNNATEDWSEPSCKKQCKKCKAI